MGESPGKFLDAHCDRYIFVDSAYRFDYHPAKGYPHHTCPGSNQTPEQAYEDVHGAPYRGCD